MAYDGNGSLEARTEVGTRTTTYLRDNLNRVTRLTLPTGRYTTMGYDNHGRPAWKRDPRDAANGGAGGARLTSFTYDDFGQLVRVDSPDTGVLIANYDSAGQKVSSQNAAGEVVTYDGANRLRFASPVFGAQTTEYDHVSKRQTGGLPVPDQRGARSASGVCDNDILRERGDALQPRHLLRGRHTCLARLWQRRNPYRAEEPPRRGHSGDVRCGARPATRLRLRGVGTGHRRSQLPGDNPVGAALRCLPWTEGSQSSWLSPSS